jgi:hypothetical protein
VYAFADLCATWQGKCWDNEILGLGKYMEDIESGVLPVTYPIWWTLRELQYLAETFPEKLRTGVDVMIYILSKCRQFF